MTRDETPNGVREVNLERSKTMTATEIHEFIALHDRGTVELNGEIIELVPARPDADSIVGGVPFTITVPEQYRGALKAEYTFRVDFTRLLPRGLWVKCLHADGSAPTYVGRLDDFTGQVQLTQASAWKETTPALRLLNRVLARVWSGDYAAFEQFGFAIKF